MKKVLFLVLILLVFSSLSFAGGDKVMERNPGGGEIGFIKNFIDPPMERQLDVNGN
jgi:hypothetical protein